MRLSSMIFTNVVTTQNSENEDIEPHFVDVINLELIDQLERNNPCWIRFHDEAKSVWASSFNTI